MNKIIIAGFAVALAAVSFGKDAAEPQLFVKPGSAKGFVAVVNKQAKVEEKEFVEAADSIRKTKAYVFKFVKDDAEAKGATAVIRLVDEAGRPPMTVSPEVGRGEMNVAVLVDDIKSDAGKKKFLVSRARREFLRTIAYAFGAGGSQFPGNIMAATKLRDLDYCSEFLPVDTLYAIEKSAKDRDLKPEIAVPYDVACEEGWAPQPVTEEQKKIWKEIHAMPENPIKIKFDPKTDR